MNSLGLRRGRRGSNGVNGYLRYLFHPPMTKACGWVMYMVQPRMVWIVRALMQGLQFRAPVSPCSRGGDGVHQFLIVDLPAGDLLIVDEYHRDAVPELDGQ